MRMDVSRLEREKFNCSVRRWRRDWSEVMLDVAYAPISFSCFRTVLLEMRYISLRYNNCSPVSDKCNLFTKYLLLLFCRAGLCWMVPHSIVLNISLFSYTFRCCFFTFFYLLSLLRLCRSSLLCFCAGQEGE